MSSTDPARIYLITDGDAGYVGVTTQDLDRRLRGHQRPLPRASRWAQSTDVTIELLEGVADGAEIEMVRRSVPSSRDGPCLSDPPTGEGSARAPTTPRLLRYERRLAMGFFRNRRLPPPSAEDIDAGCRFLFGMPWDEFVDLPEDESDALMRDYLASPEFDRALAFMREHHPAEAMVTMTLIERFKRGRA